ncbi:hypothetical protein OS493_018600 [Desmophyllum pertusum]|uniref:ATP-dependent RNA helicase n=1 Tax=Desmophyllum pertusum TaxID=174260 RepID=A0A9X0D411_9CNID|nr:hypothetical protein OS493_018600 [Desmophyllum pertusum]
MAVAFVVCSRRASYFLSRKCYFSGSKMRFFHSFGIKDVLLKRLKNFRIEKPTAIQEKALGPVLEGKNTVINAETGSGKTLCYLLPIINKLLVDKGAVSKPPYALVLLPSIELCNQVANVFQSLTDDTMQACIVHRDSRLQINPKYPIILATPSSLFTYSLTSLNNVQMIITDEADLVLTGGGNKIWKILSFFKGVDSIKMSRKQQRRFTRQKSSQGQSDAGEQESHSSLNKSNEIVKTDLHPNGQNANIQPDMAPSSTQRQFVFVAATLPSRGKKAIYNVLKDWLPDAEFVSTDLVHHTVPTVDIFYVKVEEALKLPELLRCLNSLVGLIKYPLTTTGKRSNDEAIVVNERNVGYSANSSSDQEKDTEMFPVEEKVESLDSEETHFEDESQRSQKEVFLEPVRLRNLRVLAFVNTAKAAEQAFDFLSDTREVEESASIPWKHVTQNDKTITTWQNDRDEFDEDGTVARQHVVTHTGFKDMWLGKVGQIHKNVTPAERIETLKQFTSGELKVLICTDLASRGLDIPDVSHVIQLDFALDAAQVLHRTGRTARAGASGKVINFVSEKDEDLARAVRACEDSPNSDGYEATFSRNRMFRKRVKNNAIPLADKL